MFSYTDVYRAARDLGYSELEAMAYGDQPDLFAGDHPDVFAGPDAEGVFIERAGVTR